VARGAINLPIVTEYNPKGLERAIKDFKKLETNGQKAAFAFKKAFLPATAALGGLVAAAVPAIRKASDLGEAQSKVTQIFGDSATAIIEFSRSADTALGQSEIAVLEAAGTFGTFGKAAGLSGEALSTFSNDFTALASDLASFNNTTPEDAVQALGAALRGESEPLRRYGVLLDDATLRAEALNLGIYDGNGALNAQQKILAAQQVIFRQTTDAQGDFARTSDGLANQTRILSARLENMAAEIGQALLPIIDKLLPVVQSLTEFIADNTDVVLIAGAAIAGLATTIIAVNAAMKVYSAIQTAIAIKNAVLAGSFNALMIKAAAVFAAIGGAVAIYKLMSSEKNRLNGITQDFTTALELEGQAQREAVDATLAKLLSTERMVELAEAAQVSASDLAAAITGEESPALDELRARFDSLNDATASADVNARNLRKEFGDNAPQVRALLNEVDRLRNSYVNAEQATERLANTTQDLERDTSANIRTQQAMADATAAVERAMIAYDKSLEATAEQIRDLTNATLEQFNQDLAYENQVRRTEDAIREYALTTSDAEASTRDIEQAAADAAAAALAQAAAAVQANDDIAAMTDEVEKAAAQNELLRIELEKVANTLDPSDPLRRQLLGYIAELNSIPGSRETVITTRYRAIQEAEAAATAFRSSTSFQQAVEGTFQLPAFASGGIVTRPTVGLIGEAGPEAIVPLNKAGALGNTFNITVTSADPNAVVDAIRKYNRISGPAPIKVA